jgi:hypothetical protein
MDRHLRILSHDRAGRFNPVEPNALVRPIRTLLPGRA